MGHDARKPVFGVSDKVRLKLVSSATETSKLRYGTSQKANNKRADQTARMRRLVCAFVVRRPRKTGFLGSRPITYVDGKTED